MRLTQSKFLEALEGTRGNMTVIAEKLQMSREYLYEYLNKHPNLKPKFESEKWKRQEIAEAMLDKKIAEGDMKAITLALTKHKRGRQMGYGDAIEINGAVDLSFKDQLQQDRDFLTKLSTEAREELLKNL